MTCYLITWWLLSIICNSIRYFHLQLYSLKIVLTWNSKLLWCACAIMFSFTGCYNVITLYIWYLVCCSDIYIYIYSDNQYIYIYKYIYIYIYIYSDNQYIYIYIAIYNHKLYITIYIYESYKNNQFYYIQ